MSGYGWLTESSLLPKKSKPIANDDQSSLFGLRAVLQRERQRVSAGQNERQQKIMRKPQGVARNAGVEERAKRDERQIAAKAHEGAKMLQVKGRVYDSLESKGQNVSKLLVDFSAKALLQEDEEYQSIRNEFYAGKMQEIEQQREQMGQSDGVGERDVRQRLAWQREVLGKLRGEQQQREKVQQVFDRRLLGEQKQALSEVIKQISEESKWLYEVKQRREELQQQRIRKLMKLNILPEKITTPTKDVSPNHDNKEEKQAHIVKEQTLAEHQPLPDPKQ